MKHTEGEVIQFCNIYICATSFPLQHQGPAATKAPCEFAPDRIRGVADDLADDLDGNVERLIPSAKREGARRSGGKRELA